MRKTKIIATLGPASNSDVAIRELIDAGVDVFRFNFSHGTHDGHAETMARVRRAAEHKRRIVALLQDLSGPKIRTGRLRGHTPITLTKGDPLTIAVSRPHSISPVWCVPVTVCSSMMGASNCAWKR
jgi:pyruvate kinase